MWIAWAFFDGNIYQDFPPEFFQLLFNLAHDVVSFLFN